MVQTDSDKKPRVSMFFIILTVLELFMILGLLSQLYIDLQDQGVLSFTKRAQQVGDSYVLETNVWGPMQYQINSISPVSFYGVTCGDHPFNLNGVSSHVATESEAVGRCLQMSGNINTASIEALATKFKLESGRIPGPTTFSVMAVLKSSSYFELYHTGVKHSLGFLIWQNGLSEFMLILILVLFAFQTVVLSVPRKHILAVVSTNDPAETESGSEESSASC
jgi:hypothetical protein